MQYFGESLIKKILQARRESFQPRQPQCLRQYNIFKNASFSGGLILRMIVAKNDLIDLE